MIPELSILAAFTVAAFILIVTPGPDMTLFVGETLRGGRARGFAAMLGAFTGVLVHTLLATAGLSALLAASATAFTALKIIGALYLLWLAWQAVRHGSSLTIEAGSGVRRPLFKTYLLGVGINLLNPKVVMFFVTFLPQFVSADDPQAAAKLFALGMYFNILGLPICGAMVLGAERLTAAIRRNPRVMRAIDWTFAGLMSAFAARLLLARGT